MSWSAPPLEVLPGLTPNPTQARANLLKVNAAGDTDEADIPDAPVNTVAPVASGTATVGSTLSCTTGTWTNEPSGYTYQWKRQDGANPAVNEPALGTGSTFVVVSGDAGMDVFCTVTAVNGAGSTSEDSNKISIPA